MVEVIRRYESLPFVQYHVSLPHGDFLSLLRVAAAIVGNSSAALFEAPLVGTPAVNVGIRQEGRGGAEDGIQVEHDAGAIQAAIEKALHDEERRARLERLEHPYGDGNASGKIVDLLKLVELGPALLRKRITY